MVNLSSVCKFWPIFCCGSSISSIFKSKKKNKKASFGKETEETIGNFRSNKSNILLPLKKKFTGYTLKQNGNERVLLKLH